MFFFDINRLITNANAMRVAGRDTKMYPKDYVQFVIKRLALSIAMKIATVTK